MKKLLSLFLLACTAMLPWVSADDLQLNTLWQKNAGDYTWLGTGNTERGMAYNPTTNHLLVAARSGGVAVQILDAGTGDHVGSLNMTGVSGGLFAINKVAVSDDGAIYVGNLTTDALSPDFRLYRWADESATPVRVFSGHPGNGAPSPDTRFGDSIAVRGVGAETEILLGTWDGTILALLTPNSEDLNEPDGFSSQVIASDLPVGHGRNVAFAEGNILYLTRPALSSDSPSIGFLYEAELDAAELTANTLRQFDGGRIARGLGPIGVDPTSGILAGLRPFSNDIYIFSLSQLDISSTINPRWVANFGSSTSNGNGVGDVIVVGNRIYGLHTNNGILALELTPVAPGDIFWTTADAIRTAEFNGDNPRTVLGGLTRAIGISIDPVRQHIYYADDGAGIIGRVDLNGLKSTVILNRPNPQFLKVHQDKLYWAEWHGGLFRANLDGTEIEQLIDLGPDSQSASVVIGADGQVYLGTVAGTLYRPTAAPESPEVVLTYGASRATYGLVAHPTNGNLYATGFNSGEIYSIDLSNGQPTPLNAQTRPLGIDVTRDGTQIVWAERTDGAIRISGLGQDDTITTLVSGENSPFGIVVLPEPAEVPEGFAGWIAQFELPAGQQGPQDDPDGDGIPNLLEYALGGDPASANSALLPVTGFESDGGQEFLALAITRNPDAVDLNYIVEVSSDLVEWNAGSEHVVIVEDTASTLVVRDLVPLSGENKRFIRLRVELN